MKFLGIDYGTRRIGTAVSDENGLIAFPKEIFENDKEIFSKLENLIKEEKIKEIVVGESTDLKGNPNPLSLKIEVFNSLLKEKFNLPIYSQKEFLTSVEARRYQEYSAPVDASAAALILQRYLDKKNKNL